MMTHTHSLHLGAVWIYAGMLLFCLWISFFKQTSSSEKQALASFFWVSRSVLNKGLNWSEILTWDTRCFTLIEGLLVHLSQDWILTATLGATKEWPWDSCSHKQDCVSPPDKVYVDRAHDEGSSKQCLHVKRGTCVGSSCTPYPGEWCQPINHAILCTRNLLGSAHHQLPVGGECYPSSLYIHSKPRIPRSLLLPHHGRWSHCLF